MSFFEDNKKYILGSMAALLLVGAFAGGYFFARSGYAIQLAPLRFVDVNRLNSPKSLNWQVLWDALDAINKKYVDRPIDQQKLLYGAVSGMVESLGDPYTVFFTPTKSQEFKQDLKGEFSGIGAEIGLRSGMLVVIAPLEGSPAEKAGLKPQDKILKINNESTDKFNLEEAVNKIRGPKGTTVLLNVYTDGAKEPREVNIIRDKIVVKSITAEIKLVGGKKIGYLKLRRFGEDTDGQLDAGITKLLKEGARGVVLDVRNNPGGYITSAIKVSNNWVKDDQVIVSEQFGDGHQNSYKASGVPRLGGLPTVMLINEGSASASEIVAGALHDYGLAILVGKKTFGKGSVQELVDLPEGSNVKITIAKWLTPKGKNINVEGIKPDIEVENKQEGVEKGKDSQLEKALQLVGEKIR